MSGPQSAPHERMYVFHGSASTQLLGTARLVSAAQELLSVAGVTPHVTLAIHPDIAARPYTAESLQDPLEGSFPAWFRAHTSVEELSVQLPAPQFWDRISAGAWATWSQRWSTPVDGPLYPPHSPPWLTRAPRWELDPLAPALGPAAPGGWIRCSPESATEDASPTVGPESVGLFQLTDVESFWVLSSPAYLDRIATLCEGLSKKHTAFSWLTGYFDPRDVLGSLRLPMECAPELEFALVEHGYPVDVWW